jgi:hypothetical protein
VALWTWFEARRLAESLHREGIRALDGDPGADGFIELHRILPG